MKRIVRKKKIFLEVETLRTKKKLACRATSYDGNKTSSVTLNFTTEVPD